VTRKTRSKIQELGVQELVHNLFEANATYDEIGVAVQKATGKTISDSALSRARTHWAAQQQSESAMAQQLDRLTELLKADPELDLKQGALALFWKKLIQRMAAADATFDDANMLELAHLLLKAKRVDQSKEQLDLQRERLELVKQKAQTVAEKVKGAMEAANVPREKIVQMVDEILGVTA
jgi:hypothetical protein